MRKKQVLSVMMALAMVAGVAAPSITTQAATITQEQDATKVHYGTVSESDTEMLKSLFDVDFYLEQNPELASIIGTDYDKLFEHFCKCGVFEGRSCNPNFDPSAYAAAYSDLQELFGTDILKYYAHFATVGQAENRTLTTMEACANAGITVTPLTNPEVKITPQIYRVSKHFGTTDINSLISLASAVKHGNDNGSAVVVVRKDDETRKKAQGLEKIGEIKVSDGNGQFVEYTLFIAKGKSGYAAYKAEKNEKYVQGSNNGESYYKPIYVDSVPVYTTEDFVARDKYEPTEAEREYYSTYEGTPYWEYRNTIYDYTQLSLELNYPKGYTATAENTYDMTDQPHYNVTVSGDFESYPQDGVNVYVGHGGSSWSTGTNEDGDYVKTTRRYYVNSEEATAYYHASGVMDGYYTDNEGNWVAFQNEQEKYDYIDRTTVRGEGYSSWHSDSYESNAFNDKNGTVDTVYDLGIEITPGEGDNFNIKIGISNKNDNFGYYGDLDYKVTEQILTTAEYEKLTNQNNTPVTDDEDDDENNAGDDSATE